jgi:hypothetical protein
LETGEEILRREKRKAYQEIPRWEKINVYQTIPLYIKTVQKIR